MAEFEELTRSLHGLRDDLRERLPVPAAAGVRARATHQLRVRRTTTVVLAAGAVAAVALGGSTLLQPTAGPPVPPAGTPTPTATPAPMPPHPRPSPRPVVPLDDPITEVDWRGELVIEVADSQECPAGPVQFTDGTAGEPQSGELPGMVLASGMTSYGDLTGDGRAEAILTAKCFSSAEGMTSDHGWRLVVVARADDGTLRVLGWAGPPGAAMLTAWVADQRLLLEADPWQVDPADHFPGLPGLVLSYRWDGERFVGWQPASEYPPIVPFEPEQLGPPVRPRAVAAGLGCPDSELRFTRDAGDWGGTATAGEAAYQIPTRPMQQNLFDLDNTGNRLLVIELKCVRPDGTDSHGLAVFEPAGAGWDGVTVLTPPAGHMLADWHAGDVWRDDRAGQLQVGWRDEAAVDDYRTASVDYRWTGNAFMPIVE